MRTAILALMFSLLATPAFGQVEDDGESSAAAAPAAPAASKRAAPKRPAPPVGPPRWWVGFAVGTHWWTDPGHDAFAGRRDNVTGELAAGWDLVRGEGRALSVGLSWTGDGSSALAFAQESKLDVDVWAANVTGRLRLWRALGVGGGLSAAAGRAKAHIGDLSDTRWNAVGRALLGLNATTDAVHVGTLPPIRFAVFVEGGYMAGTSWAFKLKPSSALDDAIPSTGTPIGTLSPSGPLFLVSLRAQL